MRPIFRFNFPFLIASLSIIEAWYTVHSLHLVCRRKLYRRVPYQSVSLSYTHTKTALPTNIQLKYMNIPTYRVTHIINSHSKHFQTSSPWDFCVNFAIFVRIGLHDIISLIWFCVHPVFCIFFIQVRLFFVSIFSL